MIDVFEIEKRINENFFILKFYELEQVFLLQVFPFRIWLLDDNYINLDEEDVIGLAESDYCDMGSVTPLFILTNNCNLACSYCYADEGSYGCEGTFMSKHVIESTFEGLLNKYRENIKVNKPNVFNVNAVCFGGEPLLHVGGLESVLHGQNRVAEKLRKEFPNVVIKVKQHINSNGYGITSAAKEYLEANKEVIEMVFSFDGLNHDKHRKTKDGRDSSVEALESIRYYAGLGIDVSVTCCIQPDELGVFADNIKYIFEVLPSNVAVNFSFLRGSLHFRDASKENKEYIYDEEQIVNIAEIIADYIRKGHNIYNRKFGLMQERAFTYRCPAIGKKEFCVMPNGNIYPCHNFVDDKYTYGNAIEQSTYQMVNTFFDKYLEKRTIFDTKGCENCCMKSICISSFDCPSHSMFDLGDIHLNDEVICNFGRIVQKELFLNSVRELLANE